MATYTSNYGWTKPSGSDNVDISVLNNNLDDQDSTIHDAFLNMAPPFSESSTYAVDDIVLYGTGLYKCHTAVVTPGSWTGSTNWQVYKLSEGGSGGGGTTNYNALTNKPQINSVELSGNKTAAQLGLMASDGVVANPTGQTTGALTALEVGGTKYAVGGGSGTSDYTDLTNKPSINSVELSGNKTTSDLGINADNVMMSDGVTSVEDALDDIYEGYKVISSVTADGVKTNATLINSLFSGISIEKDDDIIIIQNGYYRYYLAMAGVDTRYKRFVYTDFTLGSTNRVYVKCIMYDSNSGNANTAFPLMDIKTSGTTFTDNSSTVPTSGDTFVMYKK